MPTKNASDARDDPPDPRARWRYDATTGKFEIEDSRYRFDKVRRLFLGEMESYDVPIAELRLYQKKMRDLWDYKKARVQAIQARAADGRATDDDRKELARLDELEAKVRRGISHAQYVEKQQRRYTDPKGTPAAAIVPRANVRIDPANLQALEALQGIRVQRGQRAHFGREWGFAVDNMRVPAGRHQNRVQERQGIIAVPMDPGFAYYPRIPIAGTATAVPTPDLLGHTHPCRQAQLRTSRTTIYPPTKYQPKPGILKKVKAGEREFSKDEVDRAQQQVADFERKHAQALFNLKQLNEFAESIAMDDIPSGGDLLDATRSKTPRLLVTPRRNILFIPGPHTQALGTGDRKLDDATEGRLSKIAKDADRYAWNRAHASFPKSAKDAEKRVAKYQQLRDRTIAAALERELKMRIRFYDKGKEIAFPGEVATTPRRVAKKTRSEKKRERREQKEIEARGTEEIDPSKWDPW